MYLIRSPLHKSYFGRKNERKYHKIRQQFFNNIEYLDFNSFPIQDNEFRDLEHLNYKGAKKFSIWFDSLLKDSLLNVREKQKFINAKIKRFHEKY